MYQTTSYHIEPFLPLCQFRADTGTFSHRQGGLLYRYFKSTLNSTGTDMLSLPGQTGSTQTLYSSHTIVRR